MWAVKMACFRPFLRNKFSPCQIFPFDGNFFFLTKNGLSSQVEMSAQNIFPRYFNTLAHFLVDGGKPGGIVL